MANNKQLPKNRMINKGLPKFHDYEKISLADVLTSSPIAAFMIDQDHRVIYWNPALEKMTGIKAKDIIGTDRHWSIFYREKRPLMADLLLDRVVRPEHYLDNWYYGKIKPASIEHNSYEATDFFPKIGGRPRWLRFTAATIRDRKGAIVGAIESFEDITEKRRAEELYANLSNNSPLGIYVIRKGKFEFVNSQFRKILGYSRKELSRMEPFALIYPRDRNNVRKNALKMLTGKGDTPFEYRVLTKNGKIRWVFDTVASIEYGGEKAVMGNFMDVTEQKESRKDLERLRRLEASILDSISHAVLGLRKRQIIFANNSVENVFGWKPKELIGKNVRVLYRSDEEYEEIAGRFYPALAKEPTHMEEFVCRRRDGRDMICMVSSSRIGRVLKNKEIVVTYEDITERKKAEEELKKSFEKLQRGLEDTIQSIAIIVETRDPYTAGHQRQVDRLACAIAREMGLSENQVRGIHTAALVHDIGKIYVPAEMLSKPGHLSDIEYDIMKTHPRVSHDILKRIEFPWPVAQIVAQHHERVDGSGYPKGLKGDEILLEAKILAVADVVESMSSHRPYRPRVGIEKALAEIQKNSGVLYDKEVVDACLRLFKEKGFKFE